MQLEIDGFGRVALVVSGWMRVAGCWMCDAGCRGVTLTREMVLF